MTLIDTFAPFAGLALVLGGLALAASILRAAGRKAPAPVRVRADTPPRPRN